MFGHSISLVHTTPFVSKAIASVVALGLMGGASCVLAQQGPDAGATARTTAPADQTPITAPAAGTPAAQGTTTPAKPGEPAAPARRKNAKDAYTGPNTIIVLSPTPMLDGEGKQRVDPDGNLMFNPPVKQIRNKKGHPVFAGDGKPVFETATNLGYDERGKKIVAKKVKPPKMTPVSISAGTLTVDGWTGKARLNHDIADLRYMYIYAPGIGITIVSQNPFPGAKEQPGAFNDKTLRITVDGHSIELWSEKRLLGKKPLPAWVAVDRGFLLPAKFPVFGYGTTIKSPYAWPGSKGSVASKGPVEAPPLPADLRPTLLLAPCPAGMMRLGGPPALPGQKAPEQLCVPIKSPAASTATPAPAATPTAAATPSATRTQ